MDNHLFGDHFYNYRLQVGYELLVSTPGRGLQTYRLNTIAATNDFGFRLLETKDSRLWIAPELRVAYAYGRSADPGTRYSMFGIGLGPALGLNLRAGRTPVSFKISYLVSDYNEPLSDSLYERHLSFSLAVFFR